MEDNSVNAYKKEQEKEKEQEQVVGRPFSPKVQCIYPPCKKLELSRGLCGRHYRACQGMIRRSGGETTWGILEKRGKSLPAKRRGLPPDGFLVWADDSKPQTP